MDRHKTAPTATAALGRTLLGAALLGAYRKEEEQIQVGFNQMWHTVCCEMTDSAAECTARHGDGNDCLLVA
jgi:hypothetical protein